MFKVIVLFLDWLAQQLLDGVLCPWLLQPASFCAANSQEGWHNHDNGKDGAEGQGEGWRRGGGCWDSSRCAILFETPCVSSISSFFSPPAFLFCRLLLLTVELSNICLWIMQTLAKCKLLSCTSEWGLFLMRGVYVSVCVGGGEGCVFRLSRSGVYSVGNELGSGEAC